MYSLLHFTVLSVSWIIYYSVEQQDDKLEKSSHGLIEVLFMHLAMGLRKPKKILFQDSRCPGQESNNTY